MKNRFADVVIVGAGISGLSCARTLMDAGVDFMVIEADERIGGRIKSDVVDGFILDHGFQVLQTAYPEARRQLDFGELDLKPFLPGVLVRGEEGMYRLSNPVKRPQDLWETLTAPIGEFTDRLRMLKLFAKNKIGGARGILGSREMPTIDFLKGYGFSTGMIDTFFRPFFAGACLDPGIQASSRVFRYLFDVFSSGDAALPAGGMGAIPGQMAKGIPVDRMLLGSRVRSVDSRGVVLDSGERIGAGAVVVATEGPATEEFLGLKTGRRSIGEDCLYFAAKKPPVSDAFLLLNGRKGELINNIAVPSLTAPGYSPSSEALVAVVVLGNPGLAHGELERAVRKELIQWFGNDVNEWHHLKSYHIRHALPDQSPPMGSRLPGVQKVAGNIYICGEHRNIPGIQWALRSGRRTGERILRLSR